jgi:hypothetical protein
MQLYHRYQTTLGVDPRALNISQLFQHPSIADHARLISQASLSDEQYKNYWYHLQLISGKGNISASLNILLFLCV